MRPRREHPNKDWAGTYGRVSLRRAGAVQDSPANQDRLNKGAALLHGLKVKPGYEFSDHGISASKPIPRKDVERGIKAVVNQEIEALVVPAVDRLSRLGMRHVGEMLDAVEGADGRILFVKEGLDSSQPASRAIIAFLAEQARAEASNLSWRIETWHEGRRINGKWSGRRPYGSLVTSGKLTPHPEEAPIIRRIVTEFLSGKALRLIAKTLNAEGVPSPAAAKALEMVAEGRETKQKADGKWSTIAVSRVLGNPALVGWRKHNDRIVLGPDGEPVSFGEGILTPGEHARVLAELESRSTIVRNSRKRQAGSKTGGGRPARYLLTSIARCASCRYAMFGQPAAMWRGIKQNGARYVCGASSGIPCQARAAISMAQADGEVMRQLRTRLTALEPGDPILDAIAERWREATLPEDEGERAVLQSRLDAVRGRIVDLEEGRYVRGQFTTPDDLARWDGMMTRLKLQRDAVLQELDELGPPPDFDLNTLRATYAKDGWEATPPQQRRRLLQIAVAKVYIASAHKRPVPARDRVRVVLVGEDQEDAR